MQSLALFGTDSNTADGNGGGPAKGDRNALPLGLISAKSAASSSSSIPDPAKQRTPSTSTTPPTSITAEGRLLSLTPPTGPPIMVLFPATLHLAVYFSPPRPATLVSGGFAVLVMLGSWIWNWGLLSAAGVITGLGAGLTVGLGVRARPVGGWTCIAMSVAGIAILGGGGPSMGLAVTLALSTLWRHGWWLYLQPECGPVAFILSGTTADVALGFLLSSLIQVHRTEPTSQPPVPKPLASKPAPETPFATPRGGMQPWDAVTPPGLVGMRTGRRM